MGSNFLLTWQRLLLSEDTCTSGRSSIVLLHLCPVSRLPFVAFWWPDDSHLSVCCADLSEYYVHKCVETSDTANLICFSPIIIQLKTKKQKTKWFVSFIFTWPPLAPPPQLSNLVLKTNKKHPPPPPHWFVSFIFTRPPLAPAPQLSNLVIKTKP